MAKSTGVVGAFAKGERVFHQKFGYGEVSAVDGNKLTVQFEKAGEKRVVDSLPRAGLIARPWPPPGACGWLCPRKWRAVR